MMPPYQRVDVPPYSRLQRYVSETLDILTYTFFLSHTAEASLAALLAGQAMQHTG